MFGAVTPHPIHVIMERCLGTEAVYPSPEVVVMIDIPFQRGKVKR
jgi:hypothetical protein